MLQVEILAAAPLLLFLGVYHQWGRLWLEFLRDLRSYRAGYQQTPCSARPRARLDPERVRAGGPARYENRAVIGGPPCQGFTHVEGFMHVVDPFYGEGTSTSNALHAGRRPRWLRRPRISFYAAIGPQHVAAAYGRVDQAGGSLRRCRARVASALTMMAANPRPLSTACA